MEQRETSRVKTKRSSIVGPEELIAKIREYNPDANFGVVEKAFEYSQIAHLGQKRASGEPYFIHPLATAMLLADYKMDTISIVVGLLHDTVEDGGVSLSEIKKEFGEEVMSLVDGMTKVSAIKLRGSSDEEFVENLRKMILAMAKDLRVVIVKLCDRLHNMMTLQYLSEERQKKIARETLEMYAPLSERLGMGEMKGRLEDLAFPFVYPEENKWLIEYSRPYYKKAEEFLEKATKTIYRALAEEEIKAKISCRPKHLYSLWCKLQRPEIEGDIDKVYDLVAMRILVGTIKDCYAALGTVHSIWKPVPAIGIRDYIAQPKPNGYRSIHTNVFSLRERILEIQIRTFGMHEEAENGVAAHWFYSSVKSKGVSDKKLENGNLFAPSEKLSWVKQLVNWQKQLVGSQEFVDALKFDGLAHRIFIFSPNGDVYDLPQNATPVDFAYAVHTDLGNETVGAKVNGKMVALDHKLKSGDMVEIIKKEGTKPTEGWLDFVVTNMAKRKIAGYFREKNT
ncbi:hypothetical protein COT03_01280 [Candidatus Shapirobacteria bacterium CG07_land_8_20_14_0_80_39_18]|uniref:(P)ppGpp synthetase n=1 Tax=Candidatus Shapirobacteria bacterium CG07_land_8_20_14_0_80_39_18 TaxID=1974882 RepID=A0A2M6YRJ8_9BACT|nr:MAG: hypothetical protein COT03_01280 [Candidatus Shapirobacteria bacterium CG07_land_8_20_14_0_80_39_18]